SCMRLEEIADPQGLALAGFFHRRRRGWRISGQNSRTALAPASAPRAMPLVDNPLETVRSRAGCHRRDTNPPATAPETRPAAMVGLPSVVFRATTVLSRACFIRGPKPCFPDG